MMPDKDREHRLAQRRLRDAHLPRLKMLEEFDFSKNPTISAHQIHELARGDYLAKPSRSSLQARAGPAKPTCSPGWR